MKKLSLDEQVKAIKKVLSKCDNTYNYTTNEKFVGVVNYFDANNIGSSTINDMSSFYSDRGYFASWHDKNLNEIINRNKINLEDWI